MVDSKIADSKANQEAHWDKTTKLMLTHIGVWFFFGYVIHMFVVPLNKITIPILGFPLGFYMAAQKAEDRNGDLVERHHEHVDDVAEEEPDPEMREHQSGRLVPVCCFVSLGVRNLGFRHRPHPPSMAIRLQRGVPS